MKKVLTFTAIAFALFMSKASAQEAQATYFPYPEVPAELMTLSERSDFLISHFWDKCNISAAFSQPAKMSQSFRDFISFMPYASAPIVNEAVAKLIKSVKNNDDLLKLSEIAEDALYGENASYWSDDIYLPFAKAVVNNKKINKASRERFAAQVKCIESSEVGNACPDVKVTIADGTKASLRSLLSTEVPNILFFNTVGCSDCAIVRLNFETDLHVGNLLRDKKIRLISISFSEPDQEWTNAIRGFSDDWTTSASLDIDEVFDLRLMPSFYIIDNSGKISAKRLSLPQVVEFATKLDVKQ